MLPGRENRVAIARRLLDAGRPAEALDWIRRMQDPGLRIATRADLIAGFDLRGPERERQALEIEILDALGRGDEAQALRWGDSSASSTRRCCAPSSPSFRISRTRRRSNAPSITPRPSRSRTGLSPSWRVGRTCAVRARWSSRGPQSGRATSTRCWRRSPRRWRSSIPGPRRSCTAGSSIPSSRPAAAPPTRTGRATSRNSTPWRSASRPATSSRTRRPTARHCGRRTAASTGSGALVRDRSGRAAQSSSTMASTRSG